MRYPDIPWFLLDESSGAPSGGAPAPSEGGASAPAPPAEGGATPPEGAEAAPTPEGRGHDPFDGMESNDYDAVDLGPVDQGTGDEPGPPPQAPAAEAKGEPPAPATVAPTATPQAQVAPPTAPVAQAGNVSAPPQSQLDVTLEGLRTAANQTALADWAAGNLFKLTEGDIAALNENPAAIIPNLMGRAYTRAMESAANLIKNLVPEMVNSGIASQQRTSQRATEALNEFYQSNPHLSADQHGAAVDKWARSFRAMNPQASRAEAIAFVGRAVSAEFGVWPSTNGSGQAAHRAAPFAPARQGGRAPATARAPNDPYAGMEDEYD